MSGIPTNSSYRRFERTLKVWPSMADFADGRWEPGVNVVWVGQDNHVDVLISEGIDSVPVERSIPLFFSGAISQRSGESGPYFSGSGIASAIGTPFVSISDPTLDQDHDLKLAWYTGMGGSSTQTHIAELIGIIGQRFDRELLLVGGSGGGFTSLFHMAHARTPVSAFVWNPQTDLLKYSRGPVLEYLSVALGQAPAKLSGLQHEDWAALLLAGGIEHAVTGTGISRNPNARRLLYAQNATDWHVAEHTAPFLAGSPFKIDAPDRWVNGEKVVWFNDASEGHGVPPKALLIEAITGLLDTATSPSQVIRALYQKGLAPADGLHNLPRDLTLEAEGLLRDTSVYATRAPDGTPIAKAVVARDDLTSGGLRGELVETRESRVTIRLYDGFGHRLGQLDGPLVEIPRAVRVMVFGSCVGRDLIEYLDPSVFRVLGYVARQGLASAFSAPHAPVIDPVRIPHRFPRRMLEMDAASSLPSLLREIAQEIDVLVWDLTDERLGLHRHEDGSLTTDSVDIRAANPAGHLHGVEHVAYGSEEHLSLFARALAKWRDLLAGLGLLDKTVLLAPPWASESLPATAPLQSFGLTPQRGNEILGVYVEAAQQATGVPVLGRGLADVRSPLTHKWGPAPFHYDERTYVRLARELLGNLPAPSRSIFDPRLDPFMLVQRPPRPAVKQAKPKSPEQKDPKQSEPRAVARANGNQLEIQVLGVPSTVAIKVDAYRDRERVHATAWLRQTVATFSVEAPGSYRARVHVRRADGEQIALSTNSVVLG